MASEIYRYYNIPDVRDGLTELERTILYALYDARKEYGDRHIPTVLIWGRVVERLDVSHEAFMQTLRKVLDERRGIVMDHLEELPSAAEPAQRPFRKKPRQPEQGSLF